MPPIASHAPGSFSWIELATTDQHAAKHFYSSLFGWTFVDSPMGPGESYTMFQRQASNGEAGKVAGAYTLQPDMLARGIPPHWMLYFAVGNVDAAATEATALGASLLSGPFDVFEYGRMAVLTDPTGAVFSLWQAKNHPGIGLHGEPGTLCWADLSTPDPAAATNFYAALFGYQFTPGHEGYQHIRHGEQFIGGVQSPQQRNPHAPPHWLIYLQVDDCAASAARAQELGGSVRLPPLDIENAGTMAVLADPQGATFAIFRPAPRP